MLRSNCHSSDRRWALAYLLPLLAACGDGGDAPVQAQRISLEDARAKVAEPLLSPDTKGARWTVTDDDQAIAFGRAGAVPWLTLACDLRSAPATLAIVRHVEARPGQKALLPVLGNGTVSRFKVDAALHEGEWRWQGVFPASDPQFDVFTGPLELQATLPGGGTLLIEGSRIPGEFVNWCRAGGRMLRAEEAEEEAANPTPTPARPEPVDGR
jgi:hypothetical protein